MYNLIVINKILILLSLIFLVTSCWGTKIHNSGNEIPDLPPISNFMDFKDSDEILDADDLELLYEQISSSGASFKGWALSQLVMHGREPVVLQSLEDVALSGNGILKVYANFALFRLRSNPEQRLSFLLSQLDSGQDMSERTHILILLQSLNPSEDDQFTGQLRDFYMQSENDTRIGMLSFLWLFNSYEEVKNIIIAECGSEDSKLRYSAVLAIFKILESTDASVDEKLCDALAELLFDSSSEVRELVAEAARFCPPTDELISRIASLVENENIEDIRINALESISVLSNDDEVVALLMDYLFSEQNSPSIRERLILCFANFGNNPVTIGVLRHLMQTGDTQSSAVFNAIKKLGPQAQDCIPELIIIIREEKDIGAIQALGAIGEPDPEAISLLAEFLQMSAADGVTNLIKAAAIESLGLIGGRAQEHLPKILDIAENSRGILQMAAIDCTGRLHPTDPETAGLLQELLAGMEGFPSESVVRLALYRLDYQPELMLRRIQLILYERELGDEGTRKIVAMWALSQIGASAGEVVPALEIYTCAHPQLSYFARLAIACIEHNESSPTLSEALQSIEW